ncbi:DUF3238 domain-containing protein [Bacillus mycoides]
MVNIVKIRANVFIPMSWTEPQKDVQTGRVIQFEGDSREFTPHAVNTMRSRVEQEVVVDFGSFEQIYTHDFRETGDTAGALGGEMDYSFTKRL